MNKKEAIQILNQKGYKTTKRRLDILDFFEDEDRYRTAKDLNDYMENKYPGISFDTVYRNLHLYNEIGVLEFTEFNGEKQFRMKCSHDHHHHFICNKCGKTTEIDVCPMDEALHMLTNHIIEDHKFEIYGLCPLCGTA